MRFWNWRIALPVGGLLHKHERFLRSIFPSRECGDGNGAGFGWEWDAEDRRHLVFEDFQSQITIWSVECFGFLLRMVMMMVVGVVMMVLVSLFFTQVHDGPQSHADDNDTADE